MDPNVDQREPFNGRESEKARELEMAGGVPRRPANLWSAPAVGASIAGAVVFGAALLWGFPEAFLGAAAGVTVYAIHKHHSRPVARG